MSKTYCISEEFHIKRNRLFRVHGENITTRLIFAVVVAILVAHFNTTLKESGAFGTRISHIAHLFSIKFVDFNLRIICCGDTYRQVAACAVVFRPSEIRVLHVFRFQKVWQQFIIRPPRATGIGPSIVITSIPANVQHVVDS